MCNNCYESPCVCVNVKIFMRELRLEKIERESENFSGSYICDKRQETSTSFCREKNS